MHTRLCPDYRSGQRGGTVSDSSLRSELKCTLLKRGSSRSSGVILSQKLSVDEAKYFFFRDQYCSMKVHIYSIHLD